MSLGSFGPTPITTDRLIADLRALGVRPGDRVIAHISMRRISWICGGVQALIDALLTAIGPDGTLVMPAQSMDLTDPVHWINPPAPIEWHETIRASMPPFDPARTPTFGLGCVPEAFRTWPGTLRSAHPAMSFAANGPDARAILAEQPLCDPFGDPSPLAALYDLNAHALMIGTGWDTCTSLHLAERRAWGANPPLHTDGAPMRVKGTREWVRYRLPAHDDRHFSTIGTKLDDLMQRGQLGQAETIMLPLREGIDRATSLFASLP